MIAYTSNRKKNNVLYITRYLAAIAASFAFFSTAQSSVPAVRVAMDVAATLRAGVAAIAGDGVQRTSASVLGLAVDQYIWTDSKGQPRTVSLKQQGNGNPGNGGYAVQMTYCVLENGQWRTVTANMSSEGDGGFGYFVAHELYRTFDDASTGTIAAVHGQDDSPLGMDFAVTTSYSTIVATSTVATQTFKQTYPKWGTLVAMADPTAVTPKAAAAHKLYNVPVTIVWTFQKGTDFPRIDISVDISASTQGQLAFDMRGPYGVMEFADSDTNATINNVQWGDSAYLFSSNELPSGYLKQSSSWKWNAPIGTVRPFQGMLAKHSTTGVLYEMGLFEMKLGSDAGLVYSGYADHRGTSGSGFYQAANGIQQFEWPFQSAQYSGSAADGGWLANTPIYGKKFAWGSAPFYGSSLQQVFLTDTLSRAIDAYPDNGVITYRTCLIMGKSTYTGIGTAGMTETVAASSSPSCASATSVASPPDPSVMPAGVPELIANPRSFSGAWPGFSFGLNGDIPMVMSIGGSIIPIVYRPSVATWYLDLAGFADYAVATTDSVQFGVTGDSPQIVRLGGIDHIAVSRPSANAILLNTDNLTYHGSNAQVLGNWSPLIPARVSLTVSTPASFNGNWGGFDFGLPGDTPELIQLVAGGPKLPAVFRSGGGNWYVNLGGYATYDPSKLSVIQFGLPTDIPQIVNWNGSDHIAVFRPGTNQLLIDTDNQTYSGLNVFIMP